MLPDVAKNVAIKTWNTPDSDAWQPSLPMVTSFHDKKEQGRPSGVDRHTTPVALMKFRYVVNDSEVACWGRCKSKRSFSAGIKHFNFLHLPAIIIRILPLKQTCRVGPWYNSMLSLAQLLEHSRTRYWSAPVASNKGINDACKVNLASPVSPSVEASVENSMSSSLQS